ncbi:SPOR domain-containing protein [candidate division WOR-3 bacterium]|nr:SPOR domain-containing protein [candidate division WOR-3 bacterium]
MKKLLLIACALLLVFCAPKQTTVQTEGLEEVIVFGEEGEETYVSEEPVLPDAPAEEIVLPPVTEEEPVLPPLPAEEEVIAPPPIMEEEITAPLPVIEEEVVLPPPPITEEVITPPPLPATEEEIVMPVAVIEEEPYVPPAVSATPPPPPMPAPATLLGFRVQIFASSTENNASRIAGDARSSFDETVYVEHIAPYYKVRVGDFLTRDDAEVLKTKALQIGFRGAFVVETMIAP